MCVTHRKRVVPPDSYSGTAGSSEEKHDGNVRDLGKTLLITQRFGFLATGSDDVQEERTEMEAEHSVCVLRTRE